MVKVWATTIPLHLKQNECLVLYLNGLILICLETGAQRSGKTFSAIFSCQGTPKSYNKVAIDRK